MGVSNWLWVKHRWLSGAFSFERLWLFSICEYVNDTSVYYNSLLVCNKVLQWINIDFIANCPKWIAMEVCLIIIFKLVLIIGGWDIACEIKWLSRDLTHDKSALVEVMAWIPQAISHYLSLCWPSSVLPLAYGITKPQNWQTIYSSISNSFSLELYFVFWFKLLWSLFFSVQLKIEGKIIKDMCWQYICTYYHISSKYWWVGMNISFWWNSPSD